MKKFSLSFWIYFLLYAASICDAFWMRSVPFISLLCRERVTPLLFGQREARRPRPALESGPPFNFIWR